MVLPSERGDREYQKFVETDQGEVAVRVQPSDINGISPGNSSTEELEAGETYTGQWEDVTSWSAVTVAVTASAVGQIRMQFADTSTATTPIYEEKFHVEGGVFEAQKLPVLYQYYRTVYENDGSVQTGFTMATLYGSRPDPVGEPVVMRSSSNEDIGTRKKDGHQELIVHSPRMFDTLEQINKTLKNMNSVIERIGD
jgi:hypothetical protein